MGDMADMLIDQMFDVTDDEQMDGAEWWGTVGRWNRTCRCCGKGNLAWEDTEGKWRLHDGRGVHVCPVRPLK